jgi:hypothetical protein
MTILLPAQSQLFHVELFQPLLRERFLKALIPEVPKRPQPAARRQLSQPPLCPAPQLSQEWENLTSGSHLKRAREPDRSRVPGCGDGAGKKNAFELAQPMGRKSAESVEGGGGCGGFASLKLR